MHMYIKLLGTVLGACGQHSICFAVLGFHPLWGLCIYICLQVLTVLCNVAEKGPAYCQHLWPGPLLPSLLDTLAFSDTEVVGQSLELLQLLFLYRPEAVQAFLQQSGLQALERHEEEAQLQDRVHVLQQTALRG